MAWGGALLRRYGKAHDGARDDFTNTHLIYNTDHGAYYCEPLPPPPLLRKKAGAEPHGCYSPPPPPRLQFRQRHRGAAQQVLVDVFNYAQEQGIPYRGVLLDSWWYFKVRAREGRREATAACCSTRGGTSRCGEGRY